MVKLSPTMKGCCARWASSMASKGSVAATDCRYVAASRCAGAVRTHWIKPSRPAGFRVVCCQSIQRSASKRAGNSVG